MKHQDPRRWLNEREILYDPIEHFVHDPDDPPPIETPIGIWYGIFNRWAEEMARWARSWRFIP